MPATMQVSVRSRDVDEAHEVGTRVYHEHRVTVTGNLSCFALTLDATSLGPLTVGWVTYGTQVRIESAHPGHYQVNIPSAGTMLAGSRGREAVGGPGRAVVYHPDRRAELTGWTEPAPVLALRIARGALQGKLEQLLDRPLPDPPELALGMDVTTGRGAQWLALVRALADGLSNGQALIHQPMVAAPFTHSLLTGLLMCASHAHRDELDAPVRSAGPAAVRAARAYIEAHAAQPLTVADIARAAGVGVRGLQQGFQRALDMSPTQYLRQVRLREAHRELSAADPATTTVAGLAARWGFAHQGRFAAQYRQRYGVLPAHTLRRR
jgi:AraC-like DNA-binding protein